MNDPDLLGGAIAAKLRLRPDVEQLYPPRPALLQPARTLTALLGDVADQPAVSVTDDDGLLEVEVGVGVSRLGSALRTGRAGIATVLETVPAGVPCRVRIRIAAIE